MLGDLQLGYLGVEVPDVAAFGAFLADVVGLVPGDDPNTLAQRRQGTAGRRGRGPVGGRHLPGLRGRGPRRLGRDRGPLERTPGTPSRHATTEEADARRVDQLAYVDAPWGVRVEVATASPKPTSPSPRRWSRAAS